MKQCWQALCGGHGRVAYGMAIFQSAITFAPEAETYRTLSETPRATVIVHRSPTFQTQKLEIQSPKKNEKSIPQPLYTPTRLPLTVVFNAVLDCCQGRGKTIHTRDGGWACCPLFVCWFVRSCVSPHQYLTRQDNLHAPERLRGHSRSRRKGF